MPDKPLIWLGTVGLVIWDLDKWRGIFARDDRARDVHIPPIEARIDLALWARCGLGMFVIYLGSALLHGGVYRPRGIELDNPAFYVLPAVMLLPIITFIIDQRRTGAS